TYGFAGPELVKAVRARAKADGRFPRVHPPGDQHAGHELGARGARICKRDGIAVDLIFPGVSSEEVATWVTRNLPFDRMYLYGAGRPFHLSWASEPVGQVVRMVERASGREVPRVEVRGRQP
ncbi:MAG: peptidase M15, partial [Alphaproteobacteria bacterium]